MTDHAPRDEQRATDRTDAARPPLLPGPPDADARRHAMLRIDQAGEQGAVKIYEGQLAVLGNRPATRATAETIRAMADQEARHLERFDELIREQGARPTALRPLWDLAGFALGATTALMGEKAALACTVAVEEVIDEHYARQSAALTPSCSPEDAEFDALVRAFRDDEVAHRDRALAAGAAEAPGYRLLSAAIKAGCRLAIRLSEKV